MSNLIELQKDQFLKDLNKIKTAHDIKFLVLDKDVLHVLKYLFVDTKEVLNYVAAMDLIDSPKRKGQPSVEVVYFLKPSKLNINCMDADFSNRPPKYKQAHIRFLPGLDNSLSNYLKSKKYITQYIASIEEVKMGFIPKESQFFETIGIDQPLQVFYNQSCYELIEINIQRSVQSLLNLCIVTGEYPIIRYSEPSEQSYQLSKATIVGKKLAFEFQQALDDYAREHTEFPPANSRPRSVLIITERSLDLFSLILHDFAYQAMAYDIVPELNCSNDIYSYRAENEKGEKENKQSELKDLVDPDWCELKHQHIIDAKEYLDAKIKSFVASNPLLVDRSKVKTTTDLLSVVAHLKDFDEERRRFILHRSLIDECIKINDQRTLALLADFEQNVAGFGHDINGEKCKKLADTLINNVLSAPQPNVTDKVRYIISYALYRGGLIEEDFFKLLSFSGVTEGHNFYSHFMASIKNFDHLGFKLIKSQAKDKPFSKTWLHETIVNDTNIYNTSRFIPAVGNTLSQAITNPLFLSEKDFPYVKDKPIEILDAEEQDNLQPANSSTSASLRNPRHKAAWSTRRNDPNKPAISRQRFFYYIVGGVTYGELKAAYDQSNLKNKDVFIGSDSIITPLEFLQSLERLTFDRSELNLKDDMKEKTSAPSFLFDQAIVPPAAAAHVHKRSELIAKPETTPVLPKKEEKEEKHKKRHKLKRLFR
ncbi:related to Protein transport protein SEC1 [Saccharomycodes ludwigii]|uniref:Related to Protein transport protein SEC1 n=1 Tax=Saccharomycodes ludwigii TaxID=36035 RepID=A0A376B481_9ASCO|nr:hypothetical protein SCDLUD_001794 [Saccharomycodes ludwigii]KAH3902006.1 hypothetical protein SCDLUD_001794 [Saccharomycodes ludwigii]SSD59389.1 related to Protein transport protein SEC1 [Saccharomycodes ludwigii]